MDEKYLKILIILLIYTFLIITRANSENHKQTTTNDNVAETHYDYQLELDEMGQIRRLPCESIRSLRDLNDQQCSILKVFNRTQVDLMDRGEVRQLAERCGCQLTIGLYDRWEKCYDTPEMRTVSDLVRVKLNETLQRPEDNGYPVYFWSDVEIISYRVSIYTSSRDYFYQLQHNPATHLSARMKQVVANNRNWFKIGIVCKKISQDRCYLYRYLENLARLDPSVFFRLVIHNQVVSDVYQASKACKILLLLRLNKYKLRPDDEIIVVANSNDGESGANSRHNSIEDNPALGDEAQDIETLIYRAKSLMPTNCKPKPSTDDDSHQQHKNTTGQSEDHAESATCPILFDQGDTGDNIKVWLAHNATAPAARSMAAVQCGCRLLMYNSVWDNMISKDSDVELMAKALTNYLNNNRVPDIASSPVWVLHGWFEDIMWNLSKSRKGPIREIMKVRRGGQEDPTDPASRDGVAEALDILRRGCLVVVLNYDPATRRKGRFKLVQYLDDLESISSDPMFVFQLTLQDINLFKIYALSKMCKPIM